MHSDDTTLVFVLKEVHANSIAGSIRKFSLFHWLDAFFAVFLTCGTVLHNRRDILVDP